MLRNRRKLSWLVALLIISGGVTLLWRLPFALTETTAPANQIRPSPAPELSAYEPEVQQLLETTYLGHAAALPDPGEPAVVLKKYLEQNAHGRHSLLAEQSDELDAAVAEWEALVQQYPKSRYALVGLAKHYRTKALATGDSQYTRQAADAYVHASDLALAHGHIRYTREVATLLGELGDRKGLDKVFGRILAQSKDQDRTRFYLALVDYAEELARFDDKRAWAYFEQAVNLHPENNLEAINRYAQRLLDRGQVRKAFEILDTRLTVEQRVKYVLPAQLRKRAMESLGLNAASANAEVALSKQRLSDRQWGYTLPLNPEISALGSETVVQALTDSRISTIFAVRTADSRIRQDAIFSPNGVMNNRWPVMSPSSTAKKLATLKWPSSNRAGLVRIDANNKVYYRYFNGSAWQKIECPGSQGKVDWCSLGALPNGYYAVDIAAVVYANNQADIFAVANDNCTIYSNRSVNGTTWGAWQWWGACGDNITVALMPNGTGFAAIRVTGAGNQAAVRYFNGSTWAGSWTGIGGVVNDLALLAYANPSQVGGIRMGLSAVGADNCTVYGNNWNGSSWSGWFAVTSCFDKIFAFNTSDGGAYQLFIHRDTDYLYTQRFTGSAWAGIVPQGGTRTWIAAAGLNIDDEAGNAYEHTEARDDCRIQPYASGPVCDTYGHCFWTQGVNLAEIIYNEARGETPGAQDTVGWVVRNRAFQGLSCDSYPGAQGGGTLTTTCRNTVPCNDPNFCGNTQRYCCAIHGGATQLGTSGYQFNDEHVDINTLSSSGVIWEAFYVGNGWAPDVSTSWCPPGVVGCSFACDRPDSTYGDNYNSPSPNGPMEFRGFDYCASASSCKRYMRDICGNTDSTVPPDGNPIEVPPNSACPPLNTSRGSKDNFFWNR